MTMLERRSKSGDPADPKSPEDTVRLNRRDFNRRRRLQRLRRGRPMVAVVAVLLVIAVGGWAVYFSSLVTARSVEVVGTGVRAKSVEAAAAVPLGTPLARIDLAAIRARVQQLPTVRSAQVSRSWPHGIRIAVTARTPVAVIDRGSGLQALDEQGALFRHYASRPAGLPLVRTEPNTPTVALAEAARVVTSLDAAIARRVDYVEVETIDKITLVLKNGRTVNWGSAAQSGLKSQVLSVLLRHHAQKIDVSAPDRPTTSN